MASQINEKKREKNQIEEIKNEKEVITPIQQNYKLPSEIITNNSMHTNY